MCRKPKNSSSPEVAWTEDFLLVYLFVLIKHFGLSIFCSFLPYSYHGWMARLWPFSKHALLFSGSCSSAFVNVTYFSNKILSFFPNFLFLSLFFLFFFSICGTNTSSSWYQTDSNTTKRNGFKLRRADLGQMWRGNPLLRRQWGPGTAVQSCVCPIPQGVRGHGWVLWARAGGGTQSTAEGGVVEL